MIMNFLCKNFQERLCRDFTVGDNRLHKEWWNEYSFPGRPVVKLLIFCQVVSVGTEEKIYCCDTDLLNISSEGALGVNLDHG